MTILRALYPLARPVLRRLDPEVAHTLTLKTLSHLAPWGKAAADPRLRIRALDLDFPNPIGLAAGFDKNAEVPRAMLALGFGFVEVGSITPLPQAGNPRPRIFRLEDDRAVVNRLGFNNQGLEAAKRRLQKLSRADGIVGVNLGANKDAADRVADYVRGLIELGPLASYVTVNISSPNTPGLRGLQNRSELETLIGKLLEARAKLSRRVPLVVKIAPDLDEAALADVASIALATKIDGLIVSNTTITRPATLKSANARETGGLSGAPLFAISTEMLRRMYRLTEGKLALIGVGGIASGADAYAKIRAGASLVQLYTALTYEGPGLVTRITSELLALLARDGFASISQAIGADTAPNDRPSAGFPQGAA
jgi:dihydroorotate dehydrogenase